GNYAGEKRDITDGRTITASGWQGFKLGSDGFLTLSAEYRDREPTNRSDVDPRVTPRRITSRFGDAKIEDLSLYANAGKPLNDTWSAYGWVGYQQRDGSSSATFRLPTDATQNILSVYPNGYLPLILTDTEDFSIAGGLRGETGGWRIDSNLVFGKNTIDFGVENTLNPSLGPTSPTSFKAGGVQYEQLAYKLDAAREFDVGLAGPLNVALGLEARREDYSIAPGEPGSYIRGPFTTLALGSRGFTGFTPGNAVDVDRHSVGVYADLEGKLTDKLTASAAIRYEDYSDFGDNLSGKVSARYDFSPSFAIRGAASTGFRAPSLQQQYFTSTAIVYINGTPFETGTYPSVSTQGASLGGTALEAEKSRNYSLGLVWRRGPLELTLDAYRIEVDDRIILSETLTGNATAAAGTNARVIFDLLAPYGASAARFFINGVDTATEGLDAVARYRFDTERAGSFDLTVAGNVNNFDVTKTPTTTVLPQPQTLFGRQAVLRFENGTPPWKVSSQADWSRGPLGATLRATFYGDVLSAGSTADGLNDSKTGDKAVIDLEARYRFGFGATWAIGADNLFDTYPDQIPQNLNTSGAAPFSSFSPFGFNGRYLYTRLSVAW
ncbi:MAG: TonB-dependent receptor, partial [Caulobacter sp.]